MHMITKDNEQKTIYIAYIKGSPLHPCLTELTFKIEIF